MKHGGRGARAVGRAVGGGVGIQHGAAGRLTMMCGSKCLFRWALAGTHSPWMRTATGTLVSGVSLITSSVVSPVASAATPARPAPVTTTPAPGTALDVIL